MVITEEDLHELTARVDAGEVLEFASLHDELERFCEHDPDPAFVGVDDTDLVQGFLVSSSEINAAMCRWLQALGEILRRRIWARDGARTPTEWLSYFVSMAPSTARERIRVAMRLRYFPQTTERFARGELSYSKVRAITRTGRPDLEPTLLHYADAATGAQLERILREFRNARRRGQRPVDPFELRDVHLRYPDGDTVELRIRLPLIEGETLYTQLSHRAAQLHREALEARDREDPDAPPTPRHRQLMADAAMEAGDMLMGEAPPDTSGVDRHTLVLHAEAAALIEPDDGSDEPVPVRASAEARQRAMSARMLRRLACDARLAVVAHDEDGNVVTASGTTQKVPARIRRMLHARDRTCRFPSCNARRGLEAHHIVFWSDGGPTVLSNLVLLCRHHHSFVHAKRWVIHHDGHGRFGFEPPDGDIQPAVQTLPVADPLRSFSFEGWDDMEFEPGAVRSGWDGQRPDIGYAVGGLIDKLDDLHRVYSPADTAIAA